MFNYEAFFKYLRPNEGWKLKFLSTKYKLKQIITNSFTYFLSRFSYFYLKRLSIKESIELFDNNM